MSLIDQHEIIEKRLREYQMFMPTELAELFCKDPTLYTVKTSCAHQDLPYVEMINQSLVHIYRSKQSVEKTLMEYLKKKPVQLSTMGGGE